MNESYVEISPFSVLNQERNKILVKIADFIFPEGFVSRSAGILSVGKNSSKISPLSVFFLKKANFYGEMLCLMTDSVA